MLHHQPWKNDRNDDYLDKNHEGSDKGTSNCDVYSNVTSSLFKML